MTRVKRNDPSEFGRMVRQHRTLKKLSQERLGELAGVSGGYVSLIESGGRGDRPGRDVVVGIAQALGVPVVELLEAAGIAEPSDRQEGPTLEDVVRTDPRLRADQKRILLDLYRSWVGKSG